MLRIFPLPLKLYFGGGAGAALSLQQVESPLYNVASAGAGSASSCSFLNFQGHLGSEGLVVTECGSTRFIVPQSRLSEWRRPHWNPAGLLALRVSRTLNSTGGLSPASPSPYWGAQRREKAAGGGGARRAESRIQEYSEWGGGGDLWALSFLHEEAGVTGERSRTLGALKGPLPCQGIATAWEEPGARVEPSGPG